MSFNYSNTGNRSQPQNISNNNWLTTSSTVDDLSNIKKATSDAVNDYSITQTNENPKDTIQMIKWLKPAESGKISEFLGCVSWDGILYVYQVSHNVNNSTNSNSPQVTVKLINCMNFNIPVICLEWSLSKDGKNGEFIYVGLIDGTVAIIHFESNQIIELYKLKEGYP